MARVKLECDFQVKSSPATIYHFLTTEEGLSQWFADKADIKGEEFIFYWEGEPEEAKLTESEDNVFVRFRMEDMEEGEYLEFRIEKAEISNDTILFITDFVDDDEVDDQNLYWQTLIDKLKGAMGSLN